MTRFGSIDQTLALRKPDVSPQVASMEATVALVGVLGYFKPSPSHFQSKVNRSPTRSRWDRRGLFSYRSALVR